MGLRFSLGTRTLHVTLRTEARRIAIVGASGVGKTTLLRAMVGVRRAEGTLRVQGRELHGVAVERRAIGWVPQEAALFPHLSVRENVAFAASSSIDALEETLGLTVLLDRRTDTLSGGERQRVALARALASRPKLLLLDEPLSALDRDARASVAAAIEQHRAALDATLVLVSHDEADVAALADETYVLDASGALASR